MANKKFSEFDVGQSIDALDYLVGYGQTGNVRLSRDAFVQNLPFQRIEEKNQTNGYAGLDASRKILSSQLPNTIQTESIRSVSWSAFVVVDDMDPAYYLYNFGTSNRAGVFSVEDVYGNNIAFFNFVVSAGSLYFTRIGFLQRFSVFTNGTALYVSGNGAEIYTPVSLKILNIG
jgi:hypothetical protein